MNYTPPPLNLGGVYFRLPLAAKSGKQAGKEEGSTPARRVGAPQTGAAGAREVPGASGASHPGAEGRQRREKGVPDPPAGPTEIVWAARGRRKYTPPPQIQGGAYSSPLP